MLFLTKFSDRIKLRGDSCQPAPMPLFTVAHCSEREELILSNQFNVELHKSK